MNKFSIGLTVLGGIAGGMIYKRYLDAKAAARELKRYEELDSGFYENDIYKDWQDYGSYF